MYIIGVIAVAIFAACFFGACFNIAVEWHDAWSSRRWHARWEKMTRNERLSEMKITVD